MVGVLYMKTLFIFLLIICLMILGIIIFFIIARHKLSMFTKKYYGTTDFKEALEKSELLASNTPKSLMSVESVVKKRIAKDFPELDINELKSLVEKYIRDIYLAIEMKDSSPFNENEYIKSYIDSKLNDLKNNNIVIDDLKFHNTVINNYEKNSSSAKLVFQTAFEYFEKQGSKVGKKVQDRLKVEFIYVLDDTKYDEKVRGLILHCPNCGAPVRRLGYKTCEYCGIAITDLPKKNWFLNKIIQN